MARIRTIKPQFWTDEKIGRLSVGARLLFIGTWNLADDEGILIWDARYLKGQLFPYDDCQNRMKKWMDELVTTGLIRPYSASSGSHLALISSLSRHQVVSHPMPSHFELPSVFSDFVPKYTNYSSSAPVVPLVNSIPVMEMEEGNGNGNGRRKKEMEGKRKEPYIPLPEFPNVNKITPDEYQKLLKEFGEEGTRKRIENLSLYIASKGDKYKNHYATILSWDRREQKGGQDGVNQRHSKEVPGNRPAGAFADLEERDP